MDSPTYEQNLLHAAEQCGVEREFWDIFGTHHVTSAATQRAILQSLGFQCDSVQQIEASLHARNARRFSQLLTATKVASENSVLTWLSWKLNSSLARKRSFP
jgi:hypothetical protein